MVEDKPDPPPENEGVRSDVAGGQDEGTRAAQASPPLRDESNPGQTQTDAPADDVGVPPDEDMERDDSR